MRIFTTKQALQTFLQSQINQGQTVGFVPTMGALHKGHLSLIAQAKAQNALVVCSIFVNPTQFNNAEDLAKYPRNMAQDKALLNAAGCDVLFCPTADDLYPEGVKSNSYNFGGLAKEMEGKHRPGHFDGMATVVQKLLEAVRPKCAYFGEKDFQQLAIVRALVAQQSLPIEIVGCPIVREADGLALSSRNTRLSAAQRQAAPAIYQALMLVQDLKAEGKSVEKSLAKAIESINANPRLAVEYFQICDEQTLQPIVNWEDAKRPRAFVAVHAGTVRLIDNAPV